MTKHSARSLDVATRLLRHSVQKDTYAGFDAIADLRDLTRVELAIVAAQMAESVALVLNDLMPANDRDLVVAALERAIRGSAAAEALR